MASSDKCYLLIPHKEFAKDLIDALDGVEGVNRDILRRMGEQEFDNYKTIERRVNDPDCQGGGACGCEFIMASGTTFAESGTSTISIAAASGTSHVLVLDTLIQSQGDNWNLAGGTIEYTGECGAFRFGANVLLTHSSGTTPVLVSLFAREAFTRGYQNSTYTPEGFNPKLSAAGFTTTQDDGANDFSTVINLRCQTGTTGTRAFTIDEGFAWMWVTKPCGPCSCLAT